MLIRIEILDVEVPEDIKEERKSLELANQDSDHLHLRVGVRHDKDFLSEKVKAKYPILLNASDIRSVEPVHIPNHSENFMAMIVTTSDEYIVNCEFDAFLNNLKHGNYNWYDGKEPVKSNWYGDL